MLWLPHRGQIRAFDAVIREVLGQLLRVAPQCERMRFFYAGPTPTAIVLGQAINPRMHPAAPLYDYDRRAEPRLRHTPLSCTWPFQKVPWTVLLQRSEALWLTGGDTIDSREQRLVRGAAVMQLRFPNDGKEFFAQEQGPPSLQ